jgi:hypothetical protein
VRTALQKWLCLVFMKKISLAQGSTRLRPGRFHLFSFSRGLKIDEQVVSVNNFVEKGSERDSRAGSGLTPLFDRQLRDRAGSQPGYEFECVARGRSEAHPRQG